MIRVLTSDDASCVASIHQEALAGDFLPSLGHRFLSSLYEGTIGKKGIYAIGFEKKHELCGIVIGADSINTFFKEAIKARFIPLTFFLFLRIIKSPSIIKKITETFLYSKKDQGPTPELIVITIKKAFQGRGIGKILVRELERIFQKRHILKYKLTVHADKPAVDFYEHLGFQRLAAFTLYNKEWYIYQKTI